MKKLTRPMLACVVLAAAAQMAGASPDPLGTWELTVQWPQGPVEVTLDVAEGENGLEVQWTGPQGTLDGQSVSYVEGELKFALQVTTTRDGSTFEDRKLPFRGQIDGDRIEGTLMSPAGRSMRVTGARRS